MNLPVELKRQIQAAPAILLNGASVKPGSTTTVTAFGFDPSFNVTSASGTALPVAGEAGYAVGCKFIKTNGAAGSVLYVNEGTASACAFNAQAGGVSAKATVVAHAVGATLLAADFGKIHTNTGASAGITLTLPAPSAVAGLSLRVQLTVAQSVTLDPLTQKIYLGGSGVADKNAIIAGVIGNFLDITSDGVDFLITNYSGVVTKEA